MLATSVNTYAIERLSIETGIGVEYGGLGTQLHIPLLKKMDAYISAGLFYASTRDNDESLGFGAGVNYFLNSQNALSVYYGTLNVERHLVEDTLEVKAEQDNGLSFGYKYFFRNKAERGFTLGASYNIYEGNSYPFFSIGYRF